MYAITSHDVCIGSIEFCPGEDIRARTAKIGYWVGREYWGQGIMTEVVGTFVGWVWRSFPKFVRIEAEVHDFNVGSGRVLKKVGFEHEGTLKWGIWKDGRLAGLEIWGLVRGSG
jgi:ribosomal-protein-alanine N-acetyltransferase